MGMQFKWAADTIGSVPDKPIQLAMQKQLDSLRRADRDMRALWSPPDVHSRDHCCWGNQSCLSMSCVERLEVRLSANAGSKAEKIVISKLDTCSARRGGWAVMS
eukprot:6024045-Amphidinium_carterae.1